VATLESHEPAVNWLTLPWWLSGQIPTMLGRRCLSVSWVSLKPKVYGILILSIVAIAF